MDFHPKFQRWSNLLNDERREPVLANSRLQMTPDDSGTEHLSTRYPSNKKVWSLTGHHGIESSITVASFGFSWQNKWRVSFHPASGSVYGSLALIHSWRGEWHWRGSGIVSGVLWVLWFETTQKKWGTRWFSGRVSRVAGYKRLWYGTAACDPWTICEYWVPLRLRDVQIMSASQIFRSTLKSHLIFGRCESSSSGLLSLNQLCGWPMRDAVAALVDNRN